MTNFKSRIYKVLLIAIATYLLLLFFWFRRTWKITSPSEVITFSPNSEIIAYATGEQIRKQINPNAGMRDNRQDTSKVEIRKVRNGKIIQSFDFFAASSIAFSSDNSMIAIGGYGGQIEIWRISDKKLLYSFRHGEHYAFQTSFLSFSPDGQTLIAWTEGYSALSDRPNQLSVWNLNDGDKQYTLSKPYNCAAASPDGQLLALGGRTEQLTLYSSKSGTPIRPIEMNKGICSHLKFSADNKLLIVEAKSGKPGGTHIHRVKDGKLLHLMSIRQLNEDKEILSDMALSPNNRYLVASYAVVYSSGIFVIFPSYPKALFGRIRIWDVENGKLIATLWGHRKGINAIAFSPDGKWLASTGKDSTIKFWRMPPRNYAWLWFLGAGGLAALVYWRRTNLVR